MKKRNLFLVVALFFATTLLAQTPILGEWITVDDSTGEQKSVVRIYQADTVLPLSSNTDYLKSHACMRMQ